MVVTDDTILAKTLKHLTTTAKVPHPWHYEHDTVGFNYRMPNLNAALGCAQMEHLDNFITKKRELAEIYKKFFAKIDIELFTEPSDRSSNYWLNTILLKNRKERDLFLKITNDHGIMTRPAWEPMHHLPMYANCFKIPLPVTEKMAACVVNIPSSANFLPKEAV